MIQRLQLLMTTLWFCFQLRFHSYAIFSRNQQVTMTWAWRACLQAVASLGQIVLGIHIHIHLGYSVESFLQLRSKLCQMPNQRYSHNQGHPGDSVTTMPQQKLTQTLSLISILHKQQARSHVTMPILTWLWLWSTDILPFMFLECNRKERLFMHPSPWIQHGWLNQPRCGPPAQCSSVGDQSGRPQWLVSLLSGWKTSTRK